MRLLPQQGSGRFNRQVLSFHYFLLPCYQFPNYWRCKYSYSLNLLQLGCRIGEWACPNYEGSISSCYWPGLWLHSSLILFYHQYYFITNSKTYRVNACTISLQGTIVDRIDYNIQNVAASVEEGFKQLQKVLSSFSWNLNKKLLNTPAKYFFSAIV